MPIAPPTHGQLKRAKRPRPKAPSRKQTTTAMGYDHRWRRFSEWYRRQHPLCVECGHLANCVDHTKAITEGGGMYDPDNLRVLCTSCHSRKTAANDGAFGNVRK